MRKKTSKKTPLSKKRVAKDKLHILAQQASPKSDKETPKKSWKRIHTVITGLAVVGMLLTGYLVLSNWFSQPILYCEEGAACDLVQKSRWGKFLGIPTAILGFFTYFVIAIVNIRTKNIIKRWKFVWSISLLGFGYSIYLQSISLIVIKSACVYCVASLLILAAILTLATFDRPKKRPQFSFSTWAKQPLVFTLIIVGVLHLHYSGIFNPAAGAEDPYLKGLAEHLTQQKAIYYGTYW